MIKCLNFKEQMQAIMNQLLNIINFVSPSAPICNHKEEESYLDLWDEQLIRRPLNLQEYMKEGQLS